MTEEVDRLIEQYDLCHAVEETCTIILRLITDLDEAYQFVMVELDSVRTGSPVSRRFVEATAIPRADYKDARFSSSEEVVGPTGPIQLLNSVCSILKLLDETAVLFRLAVVDQVMEHFRIGPYTLSNSFLEQMPMESIMNQMRKGTARLADFVDKRENSNLGLFVNIMNDLAGYSETCEGDPPIVLMAYAYARRVASAGLYIQGVFDRKEYAYQEQTFRNFQQKQAIENEECQSKEFQIASNNEAGRFLTSYDKRLTSEFVSQLVGTVLAIAPNQQVLCPKDKNMLIAADGVFAWFEKNN